MTSSEAVIGVIVLILCALLVWLVIDLVNGQLQRDLKSASLGKHLIRAVASKNIQQIQSEEVKANRCVTKIRLIKQHGKLTLKIPCGVNNAVMDVVKSRCDEYLLKWLNTNYGHIGWRPIEVHTGVLFNTLIVTQK